MKEITHEELIFLIDKYMDKYQVKKNMAKKMVMEKHKVSTK